MRPRRSEIGAAERPRTSRLLGRLVDGRSSLTLGLLFDGVASYVFLTSAGRALGPERYATVSVLWVVLFLVGNGLFIPVEQELSRSIAARRARGLGTINLVRRVATASGSLLAVVGIGALLDRDRIAASLFRGDAGFVVVLVAGIAGVWLMYLVRGVLAGHARYHRFALLFVADALAKAIPAALLLAAGVVTPLAFGLVMAASACVGALVSIAGAAPELHGAAEDPVPEWGRLLSSLGFLLMTSFLSALTVNIGTLAIEVLGTGVDVDKTGIFLSGLVIARVPLFLFQAVQAIVLPHLSGLAAIDDLPAFRADLRRLASVLAASTVVATLASATFGPLAVRLLFGSDYALLGARDMGLMTLASMLMTGALTLNQAQIALRHQRQTGWPWGVAALVFLAVVTADRADLFQRVELAMVAAGTVVLALVALLLACELRHPDVARHAVVVDA